MRQSGTSRRYFLITGGSIATGVAVSGCTDQPEVESSGNEEAPPSDQTQTDPQTESVTDNNQQDHSEDNPELGHLHGMAAKTYPPDIDGHHNRRYEWEAFGGEWWLEMNLPKSLEEYYEKRPRPWRTQAYPHWGSFVSDPYDREHVRFVADELDRIGAEYGLSNPEIVDLSMKFVQQLRYTPDDISTPYNQYARYPIQTLIQRGGDCVDTSILLASILRELGYGCVLLALWDVEHMAVGVKGDSSISGTYYDFDGDRYYYVETTGPGSSFGEIPPKFRNASADIQEIHANPTLVHSWESSMNNQGGIDVTTTIWNVGQVTAQNTGLSVTFESQSGNYHATGRSSLGSLAPETSTTELLKLEPPDDRSLRLNTELTIGRDIYDSYESEFRTPV